MWAQGFPEAGSHPVEKQGSPTRWSRREVNGFERYARRRGWLGLSEKVGERYKDDT